MNEARTVDMTKTQSEPATGAEEARLRLLTDLPLSERRIQPAGISTSVLEGGNGPPIVLLHGPGEYAAKWFRVIPELIKSHRVIAPDLPGHGKSGAIDGPIKPDHLLAWLGELIEQSCQSPAILVGHILGGAIAARYAAAGGSGLRCLVLADALGLAHFQPAPQFGKALTTFVTEPTTETHDALWRHCAFDLDRLRTGMGPMWDSLKAYNLDRAQAASLKPTQQGLMEQFGFPGIAPDDLARIEVPTVLIWGRHDLATPLKVAEEVSARHSWPLYVIEDAADDPAIEQPAAFIKALQTAISKYGEATTAPDTTPDTHEAWDRIAVGYDKTNTETQMWLAGEALMYAKLQPGMQFLDVACGSGALAVPAARIGAEVFAVDQSPAMLQLLRDRAQKEALAIDTSVMDGHALQLEDDSFDMAGSQFGVMLFPDMPRGIREMARVVRPGGTVLVIAYGDPHEIDFLRYLVGAVQSVRPDFEGPPMDPPPLPFQLSDPERLRAELEAVGLKKVSVETINERTAFNSGEELWNWIVWSNPIVEEVLGELSLNQAARDAIRDALDKMVQEQADDGGQAYLTNPVNIGIGKK
ncbi:alpha/beta fold hydrolase [Nitratireductor luteus]|uniref:alpha/beta fold hydrolase n=1 Tax=Nitratireductor luteus TaxID=2976980 RepID=UPI00223F5FEE|nr:alpha/beta fold hydrolase [Nitratireductor luteus]